MNLPVNQIICGSALTELPKLPSESANCSISSPPYWALRDYGVDGQLGLEPTFEEYINKLCTIYDEVKRVLRPDGTCFVNLGDTYGGGCGGANTKSQLQLNNTGSLVERKSLGYDKCLMLIPQRFAIEMVNRGWLLRNVIVWHKPNPMPSSAKDRFTVDFEYVYFFVKSKKYWFEPQYEPMLDASIERQKSGLNAISPDDMFVASAAYNRNEPYEPNPLGRNKRTVWTIPTQSYPEAHFATYPEKLVEPMIKAGCPEFICKKCGKAREKIYEKGELVPDAPQYKPRGNMNKPKGVCPPFTPAGKTQGHPNFHYKQTFKGYTDCGCNIGWRSGIVLDMFRWQRDYFNGRRPVAA